MQPQRVEREFGIPFAGKILEPTQWAQTALKKWPEEGRLNWVEIFGRTAPVVLDLGCGNGRFLREVGEVATERVIPPHPAGPPDMSKLGPPIVKRGGMVILGPPGPPPGH